MRAVLLRALCVLLLAACAGDVEGPSAAHDDGAVVRELPAGTSPASSAPPAPVPAVLEKDFLVEEGVWYLSDGDLPRIVEPEGNGLLYPGGRQGLWVSVPGLYGRWPVRLEVRGARPRVADWCEDVVEVPYAHTGSDIEMGSFESWSRSLALPPGDYRVRLCATGLDSAAQEPEFDGRRYHVYSSRHLIQLWPAAPEAEAVLRAGSRWAAQQHRPGDT